MSITPEQQELMAKQTKFTDDDLSKKGFIKNAFGQYEKLQKGETIENGNVMVKTIRAGRKPHKEVQEEIYDGIKFNANMHDEIGTMPSGITFSQPPTKIAIKPLSVNSAWQGRRFKSDDYKYWTIKVLTLLPATYNLPKPPYEIRFTFGFSSSASDWDNCIKTAQDVIAKKYNFNDKLIRKGVVETEIVPKGKEFFSFSINHYSK